MDATNHHNRAQSNAPLVLGGFGNQARPSGSQPRPSALAGIMGAMGAGEESKEKKPHGNGLLEAMTVRFNDIEQI